MTRDEGEIRALCAVANSWAERLSADPLSVSWVDVVREALTFVRDNPPTAESWQLEAGLVGAYSLVTQHEIKKALVKAASEVAGDDETAAPASGPNMLEIETVAAVVSKATGDLAQPLVAPSLTAAVVANALARAVDEVHADAFMGWFRANLEITLKPGELYPVSRHDLTSVMGPHSLNTEPARLPSRSLTRTARLALAGERAVEYEYVVDFRLWGRLAPFADGDRLTIAVLQPSLDLSEFDVDWDHEERSFVNKGPHDADRVLKVVKRQIRQAADEGADLIVLPEYAIDDATWAELENSTSVAVRKPTLLVAGVSCGTENGRVANEAKLIVTTPKMSPLGTRPHLKLHGARIADYVKGRDGKVEKVTYQEKVIEGAEVRVYVSDNWTVAVLTCLDAMLPSIIDQLADIGVNLLIVPAMTPRTATMVSQVRRLQSESQAFTVIGAGPPFGWPVKLVDETEAAQEIECSEGDRAAGAVESVDPGVAEGAPGEEEARWQSDLAEAVFGGPYATGSDVVRAPAEDADVTRSAVGLWLFDSVNRDVRFLPTPLDE